MSKRNLYLNTKPVETALAEYMEKLQNCTLPQNEIISVAESLGRVTAKAVFAKCCSPLFNAAAMDGIAVKVAATKGASEAQPVILEEGSDYIEVDTGDPVHLPYDAVIMAEDLMPVDKEHVKIIQPVPVWQHVRPIGEDIVEGEMLVPGGHVMRPVDMGAVIAGGNSHIEVFPKPKVAIIPTGTEIIKSGDDITDGSIIDSNSYMFSGMVSEKGGVPKVYSIVEDDYEKIKKTVEDALAENDIVIVNAGSSAGREDYTVHILRELGEVVVHGVAIKPGKPVILAIAGGKPVIGLPGYPVSAYIDFENFVIPVMNLFSGLQTLKRNAVKATLSKRLVSSLKHREYVRVRVGKVEDKFVATPLARGAGAAMSLVKADGFCVVPQDSEGFEAGEEVEIELYKPIDELQNTLVSIGSHDLILDVIADKINLSSTHVGSMGGLMALKRGETTIAPTHLLDMETGEYNISYIKNLFPDKKMALIKGVNRIQGIMVKKDNPLKIKGVKDLVNCRYVNRQKGAGTRVLLDYKLKLEGIDPAQIDGYDKEATTHMAVAALVAREDIDAGMGIESAARTMGLDFVVVGPEEYDFAIEAKSLEMPEVKAFIEVLKSEEFHKKLEEMGGYGWDNAGEVVIIE
ncbi:MAG: molybdopterin biosynthesis protein [Firmicutes bacterium]|nr:molybdopterin biosynthesis protein [Bacillota bacterium]